ncbi:MAG TPA: 6-phosphogluconolactonase [Verrucomicrobiae bacterium]|nr:6-phosphogluconolactonase [Verrucomicrobiae bacterium]
MNPKLHLQVLPTAEEIARTAAAQMIGLLRRRADLSIPFGLALSGGRIAGTFYRALTAAAQGKPDDFESVHFFWADERCVPAFDPENNYLIARPSLFEPLKIPEENIHRIRGEIKSEYAVQEAEAEICRVLPLNEAGQPLLDLVVLGMGEDGHVASLFPSEGPEWVDEGSVYRKVMATKPPPERITLGYQAILSAKEVWVLAVGPSKADALRRLQTGDPSLPISRIVAGRPATTVYCEPLA